MIVCKFGGTSVGNVAAIERVISIVASRQQERPLVVLSALNGVTNDLLALCRAEPDERPALLTALIRRHEDLARGLNVPGEALVDLRADAAAIAERLARFDGVPPSDELRDWLVSHGELWSSRLVVSALQQAGVPAVWVDIRPVMQTDAQFGRAVPEQNGLPARALPELGPLLEGGQVPVTQGFIGATADGRTTTLGRGGSDYTATLLAAALGAERVEIWTDVDGIMTADPRIVPEARVLRTTSHLEAAELSAFGAKVLHPATQAPLVERGITCVVLNSFAPEQPGTTIISGHRPEPVVDTSPVRAVSWKPGVTLLNVRSPRMLGASGFLYRLFGVFHDHGVAVDVLATSEVNVSLTVDSDGPIEALCRDLSLLGEVTLYPNRAIIAVVGVDLRGTRGLSGRLFQAIREINVEVISQGASEINVTFVVKAEEGADAVRLLHREFFGPAEVAL